MNALQQTELTYEEVDAPTVARWCEEGDVVLVDVRETSEFEQERIPGAFLMPLSMFDGSLFPQIPGKRVVLYCAIGKRSGSAARMLVEAGHDRVIHMIGGLTDWKAHGFITVS